MPRNEILFAVEEFRAMLRAPDNYDKFGDFNRIILRRSVSEINALAPFSISAAPVKTGKKVTGIHLSGWPKSTPEQQAAEAEINRSKVGPRHARRQLPCRARGKGCDPSTNGMISSFSAAGYLIRGRPQPRSCFFEHRFSRREIGHRLLPDL